MVICSCSVHVKSDKHVGAILIISYKKRHLQIVKYPSFNTFQQPAATVSLNKGEHNILQSPNKLLANGHGDARCRPNESTRDSAFGSRCRF